jgi:U3 small nucleolar ribonucleoprotein component
MSRHERYQFEMKQKIKEFEEENIQRRSWELMGEVGAGQRPKSSLMEAEMDYQMNTKTGKYSFCTCCRLLHKVAKVAKVDAVTQ